MIPRKIAILILASATILSGCSLFKKKTDENDSPKKPPINEPVNVIPTQARPFVSITPRSDGRQVTLKVDNLSKQADEMEYELEYQSGSLLQGAFGSFDFTSEPTPTSTDILLGSCSAGGACTFHQDVSGGTLTMRFRGQENYVLKTEWRFLETSKQKGIFSSRDSKFQLNSTDLNGNTIVIIAQTSGLPSPVPGDLNSDPYGVFVSSSIPKSAKGELSMRLKDDSSTATIWGFDGSDWIEFTATVKDKTAFANVSILPVFVVSK